MSTTIDSFLDAVTAGAGIPVELYADDATLDATVPNWRFHLTGAATIAAEYGRWFAAPGSFAELERHALAEGEVVTYLLTWTEDGVPHAAHHCHQLRLAASPDGDGPIASDTVFCGGRWPEALLAQMAPEHR